jgi:hypothetical protein
MNVAQAIRSMAPALGALERTHYTVSLAHELAHRQGWATHPSAWKRLNDRLIPGSPAAIEIMFRNNLDRAALYILRAGTNAHDANTIVLPGGGKQKLLVTLERRDADVALGLSAERLSQWLDPATGNGMRLVRYIPGAQLLARGKAERLVCGPPARLTQRAKLRSAAQDAFNGIPVSIANNELLTTTTERTIWQGGRGLAAMLAVQPSHAAHVVEMLNHLWTCGNAVLPLRDLAEVVKSTRPLATELGWLNSSISKLARQCLERVIGLRVASRARPALPILGSLSTAQLRFDDRLHGVLVDVSGVAMGDPEADVALLFNHIARRHGGDAAVLMRESAAMALGDSLASYGGIDSARIESYRLLHSLQRAHRHATRVVADAPVTIQRYLSQTLMA